MSAPEVLPPENPDALAPKPRRPPTTRAGKKSAAAELCIPKDVMRRLVRELIADEQARQGNAGANPLLLDKTAYKGLHLAAEMYVMDMFGLAQDLLQMSNRHTMTPECMQNATALYSRIGAMHSG